MSIKTIQFLRGQIMRKFGVHSAVQLAVFAIREGLVGWEAAIGERPIPQDVKKPRVGRQFDR